MPLAPSITPTPSSNARLAACTVAFESFSAGKVATWVAIAMLNPLAPCICRLHESAFACGPPAASARGVSSNWCSGGAFDAEWISGHGRQDSLAADRSDDLLHAAQL